MGKTGRTKSTQVTPSLILFMSITSSFRLTHKTNGNIQQAEQGRGGGGEMFGLLVPVHSNLERYIHKHFWSDRIIVHRNCSGLVSKLQPFLQSLLRKAF